jgi:(2Fe-2S) ferredoxin
MRRYRLSVCKGPHCRQNGADAVFAAAKAELAALGEQARCEAYRGGCYGLCHRGANVVVREDTGRPRDPFSREDFQLMGWPGEVYYPATTVEGMVRIVREHIGAHTPVQALAGRAEDADDPAA